MSGCPSVRPSVCDHAMWNVEIWHVMLFGNRTIILWVFSTNTIFFLKSMHIKRSINQLTLNRAENQWVDRQMAECNNECFGIMNILMLILKFCDTRLPCDASVVFICSFHLFSFSISVTASRGRTVCDLTGTDCIVVSLLGPYRVECECRPKVPSTETLTLVTW